MNEISQWKQLMRAEPVRQQQSAFACATGLPLVLLPPGPSSAPKPSTEPPSASQGAFCVQGCLGEHSGAFCLRSLLRAERRAAASGEPVNYRCPAGLVRILAPVVVGSQHLGSLLAGPFALETNQAAQIRRQARQLQKCGLADKTRSLRRTWDRTVVLTPERSQAIATLVRMFAEYLAEFGNRLVLHRAEEPSPLMLKIEAYLREQRDEEVSLRAIARCVSLSPCHFCKVFKKQTGLTFTEYWIRWRIERAKHLLMDGHRRISEVAFEAGFNSIPYFNRAFRRCVGCAPKQYRLKTVRANGVKKSEIRA